jgi:hypothetical protein
MSSYRDGRDRPIGTVAPIDDYHLSGHTSIRGVPRGGGGSPSCNGGELSRVVSAKAKRKGKSLPEWPPKELRLPSLAELERLSRPGGVTVQRQLFPEVPDDTRQGRLARLLATVPSVTTADRLPPRRVVRSQTGGIT